jgi:hypothetical protein
MQAGFREGLDEGKEVTLQQGFNAGTSIVCCSGFSGNKQQGGMGWASLQQQYLCMHGYDDLASSVCF